MKPQGLALGAAAQGQLAGQGHFINPNAHRRHFERGFQHRVPQQNVAVQAAVAVFVRRAPVVVVGGAAVVYFAVAQLAANAHQKHRTVLAGGLVLALLGREGGVAPQQVFGVNEGDGGRQHGLDAQLVLH